MGLLDSLFGKKKGEGGKPAVSPRELARLTRLCSAKMAQNYDRQEAIEELGRMGTADSAAALLKRFKFSMEPSITDQEEKEAAAEGIVAAGDDALDAIRKYCVKADSLTWPLRVLRRIVTDDAYVDEVLGILDQFDTEYVRNSEPKVQLINALEEHPSEDVRVAVEPFLQDMSEPVRFHSVTTVLGMGNSESLPALVDALAEEESLRVRNRMAQGVLERDWAIPEDLQEACAEALPDDYALVGDKIQRG